MGGLTLLDPATGKERLRVPKAGGLSLAFSPDGKTVATCPADQMIRLWDVATGQERRVLKGHVDCAHQAAFSPDGKTLASAGRDYSVRLWDLTAEPEGEVLSGPPRAGAEPCPVAFSPDGNTAAAAGDKGGVTLRDLATGRPTTTLSLPPAPVSATAIAADGRTLAAALREDGKPAEVRLVDIEKKQHRVLEKVPDVFCPALAFSPDSAILAGAAGREVRLWDTATGKLRGALAGHISDVWSLAFSPDGKRLAVGTRQFQEAKGHRGRADLRAQGGELRVWDLSSQRQEVAFRWTLTNEAVAFSRDGKLLAAAGCHFVEAFGGGKARVWEVGTWREVATLEGHRRGVTSVAFSSDGKLLATAGEDGAVRLWDTATWQERLVLKWADRAISRLSLSADARILAAALSDGSVKVWRAAGRNEVSRHVADADDRTWAGWLHRSETAGEGWEGVAADCSKAIEAKPDAPDAWDRRAYARTQTGDYPGAIADSTQVLRLDPRNRGAYNHRGLAYWLTKDFDKAIADYTEAIRLDPKFGVPYNNRGCVYLDKGDLDKALADLNQSIRLDPKLASAYVNRGAVHFRKGDLDKALADFNEATRLDPIRAEEFDARGRLYAELSKAVQRQPTDPNVWHLRALASAADARPDEYRKDCAEMLQRFGQTDNPEEAYSVAWTCALAPGAAADWSRVAALAEKAAKSDPKSLPFVTAWGAVLYRAGRLEEATERLAQADQLLKGPADPTPKTSPACVWFFLAMAHHRLGHAADSKKWLDKAAAWSGKPPGGADRGAEAPWHRRTTLGLVRREAEALLNVAGREAQAAPPSLLEPRAGALLPNGNLEKSRTVVWEFKWSAVPRASKYHLLVIGPKATIPAVDRSGLTSPAYRHEWQAYVGGPNRFGWRWKVRALVGDVWSEWSETRTFDVEPPARAAGKPSPPQNKQRQESPKP